MVSCSLLPKRHLCTVLPYIRPEYMFRCTHFETSLSPKIFNLTKNNKKEKSREGSRPYLNFDFHHTSISMTSMVRSGGARKNPKSKKTKLENT